MLRTPSAGGFMVVLWLAAAGCRTAPVSPPKTVAEFEKAKAAENQAAAEIIALERSALDRWTRGDPSGFLEISDPEVVYFDPSLERRLDGLAGLSQLYERLRGKVQVTGYEMQNPRVQGGGGLAVLTYNYQSFGGERFNRWNCTEVYRRTANGWRIVHTHWSIAQPFGSPAQAGP